MTEVPGRDGKILEVLLEFDGPQLFLMEDELKALFLGVHTTAKGRADRWLYAPISARRAKQVVSGKKTAHDIFSAPELGILELVEIIDGLAGPIKRLRAADVPAEMLPDEPSLDGAQVQVLASPSPYIEVAARRSFQEFRVDYPLWELSSDTLDLLRRSRTPLTTVAARTRRFVMDIALTQGADRIDVSLPRLGALLSVTQKLVDALGAPHDSLGASRRSVPRPHIPLDAVASFPSSFGLRIESHDAMMFGEGSGSEAAGRFLELIRTSKDIQSLKLLFPHMGRRVAPHYRAFARALRNTGADLLLQAAFPNVLEMQTTIISRDESAYLVAALDAEPALFDRQITFSGNLVAASLPSKFFRLEADGEAVSGRISDNCIAKMPSKVINARYSANLNETLVVDDISGEESRKYVMTDIRDHG